MYYRARWYDAQQGRFLTEDPAASNDEINLYRYVSNNPISFVDPTGEWLQILGGALIGGGIDLTVQLIQNGGRIKCVDWGSVGISAGLGAAFAGLGPAGAVFGRGGAKAAQYGFEESPGLLNRTRSVRLGWSRNNKTDLQEFGFHGGSGKTRWHKTVPLLPDGTFRKEFTVGGGALGGALGAGGGNDCECK
jgi:hypothetical protein